MWRLAWLKLLVCRSNFAETDGYVRAKIKDSDGKQKQTIRMPSFQELCSIVLSVSEPVVRQDGIRKIETSISDVLKELSDPDESDLIQQVNELDQLSAESNGDILSNPVNDPSSSVQNPLLDEALLLLTDTNTEATSLSSTNTTTEAVLPFSANISTKEASPFSNDTNIAEVPSLPADASREAALLLSSIACIESVSSLPADDSKEAAMLSTADASMEAAWPFSGNIEGAGASSFLTDVNTEISAAAESIIETAIALSDDINLEDTMQLPVDAHAEAALPFSAGARQEGKEMPLDDQITEVDENLQEYASAFIQIAVKRFSVEKDICKHKKVTKLQKVMHGHFVPKDSTGAFQFYRRIRKMQELFKIHHADQSQKKRAARKKVTKKSKVPFLRKKPKVPFLQKTRQESDISGKKTERSSTLKLLYNVLAYQLTESTPQRNPNHLPNDPAKPNSAWQWLERWISHKSDIQQQKDSNLIKVVKEVDEQSDLAGIEEIKTPVAVDTSFSDDPNLSTNKEGDQIQTSSKGKTIQVLLSTTDTKADSVASSSQEEAQYNKEDFSTKDNIIGSSNLSHVAVEPASSLENCSSEDPFLETVSPTNPTERTISKHVRTERKKKSVRTIREHNPIVATLPTRGGKDNLIQVANVLATYVGEYQLSQSHSTSSVKLPEKCSADSISHESDMKIPFLDCSTQIISEPPQGTSTDIDKIFPVVKPSKRKEKSDAKSTFDHDSKVEKTSCNSQVILQNSNEKNILTDEAHNQLDVEESHTPTICMKFKDAKAPEVFPSSPAGSPRSALLQESHGEHMPPGAKLKKNKNKAYLPKQPRSPLAQNGPHSGSKNDSSGRNSTEHLPKEVKSSNNRRNSFAIANPDHDTRISNGNTIPSYMQPTESVRAKFHSDLKSIPDIQEKDNFVKRHSVHIEHSKLGLSTNMQKSIQ